MKLPPKTEEKQNVSFDLYLILYKILIKYETQYNKHIPSEFTIKSLSEFEEELKKINYNI